MVEIWPSKSRDLFRVIQASPEVKLLSPGRRTCDLLRPENVPLCPFFMCKSHLVCFTLVILRESSAAMSTIISSLEYFLGLWKGRSLGSPTAVIRTRPSSNAFHGTDIFVLILRCPAVNADSKMTLKRISINGNCNAESSHLCINELSKNWNAR